MPNWDIDTLATGENESRWWPLGCAIVLLTFAAFFAVFVVLYAAVGAVLGVLIGGALDLAGVGDWDIARGAPAGALAGALARVGELLWSAWLGMEHVWEGRLLGAAGGVTLYVVFLL